MVRLKNLFSILIVLFFFQTNRAQDIDNNVDETLYDYRILIPKLDVLVDSAWAKNGLLGYRIDEIDVKKANLKSKERYWTRNFGIQGDYRYGTFANFSENVTSASTINLASNTTQVNYGVGFFLKLPVLDIYNRKTEIKQARAELSQAINFMEFQKFEIREDVIKHYENLILKQNLLKLQAKSLGTARISIKTAEKEYKTGLIDVHEYVRIYGIANRIEADYETAKSEFILAKKLLENLTGIKIN